MEGGYRVEFLMAQIESLGSVNRGLGGYSYLRAIVSIV